MRLILINAKPSRQTGHLMLSFFCFFSGDAMMGDLADEDDEQRESLAAIVMTPVPIPTVIFASSNASRMNLANVTVGSDGQGGYSNWTMVDISYQLEEPQEEEGQIAYWALFLMVRRKEIVRLQLLTTK